MRRARVTVSVNCDHCHVSARHIDTGNKYTATAAQATAHTEAQPQAPLCAVNESDTDESSHETHCHIRHRHKSYTSSLRLISKHMAGLRDTILTIRAFTTIDDDVVETISHITHRSPHARPHTTRTTCVEGCLPTPHPIDPLAARYHASLHKSPSECSRILRACARV